MRRYAFGFAWAMIAAVCSQSAADSYSVLLEPAVHSDSRGSYLSSAFDFGVQFSEITSVLLEFTMPAGFEGNFGSTGNNSWSRELALVLHGPALPPDNIYDFSTSDSLARTAFSIRPNELAEFPFGNPRIVGPGFESPPFIWPAFALSGKGNVSIIDVYGSYFHPIGSDIARSSTSWLPPNELVSVRLTIDGIAVPEPTMVVLCVSLAILGGLPRRRRVPLAGQTF
jgi:hypothetical protein